jgi:glutathione S-transferase
MRLYGSFTSPYVRRLRILARELGEPVELVDTTTPAGQAALRAVAPLGKVPIVELDGEVVFDSRVISDLLVARRGRGPLRPPQAGDENLRSVADGALDALVNTFYLVRQDGADPALPYLARQVERAAEAFAWLAERVHGPSFSRDGGLGLPEIAVVTALGWTHFRGVYDPAAHPSLAALCATWEARPSFAATRPGVVGPG